MSRTCQRCYRVVEHACQGETEWADCKNLYPLDPPGYAARVRALESEGLTTSDAQAVADAEVLKAQVHLKQQELIKAAGRAILFSTSRALWLRDGRASNGICSCACSAADLRIAGYRLDSSGVWRRA